MFGSAHERGKGPGGGNRKEGKNVLEEKNL
jgi:hypothetical protein